MIFTIRRSCGGAQQSVLLYMFPAFLAMINANSNVHRRRIGSQVAWRVYELDIYQQRKHIDICCDDYPNGLYRIYSAQVLLFHAACGFYSII
eukprot:scaffold219809_cov19-Prasinocladus_malaysianus.AAC.1